MRILSSLSEGRSRCCEGEESGEWEKCMGKHDLGGSGMTNNWALQNTKVEGRDFVERGSPLHMAMAGSI